MLCDGLTDLNHLWWVKVEWHSGMAGGLVKSGGRGQLDLVTLDLDEVGGKVRCVFAAPLRPHRILGGLTVNRSVKAALTQW